MAKGRICNRCQTYKEWEYFAINKKGLNDRKSICKVCSNQGQLEHARKRRAENPERYAKYRREKLLVSKYKISSKIYQEMLLEQNHSCCICGRTENTVGKNFYVDHCHNTEKVRGLLCYHCNTLLGMAFDNPKILRSAADYVEKHKS